MTYALLTDINSVCMCL